MYFANGTLVVLADDSHLVGAAVAHGLVVALAHSDELGLFGTEDAFGWHDVEIYFIKTLLSNRVKDYRSAGA